ncbi:type II toxin-antitoxin system VapC family toxin [Desulfobacter sp. UBA2225]|uniref:type II toxin-antitoxin system VapC family toxin n=1 Tax=Desulfobacter sp. UBA2225 TaxID=1961413 RepID=UPI00257A027A|nr:type II toxin-antitoxin system VapC family toxin [Desulfobacter sp. UBA2225]
MRILVDTHIYLWMLSCPEKLSDARRYELESSVNEVFFSSISIAELMIKHSIGKINITFNPLEMAMEMGLETLNFTGEDALLLKSLPFFHKDPFDRMLIAQSMTNKLALMSDDSKIKKYDCKLI